MTTTTDTAHTCPVCGDTLQVDHTDNTGFCVECFHVYDLATFTDTFMSVDAEAAAHG